MKNRTFIFLVGILSSLFMQLLAQPTFKTLINGPISFGSNILPVDSGYILYDYGNSTEVVGFLRTTFDVNIIVI